MEITKLKLDDIEYEEKILTEVMYKDLEGPVYLKMEKLVIQLLRRKVMSSNDIRTLESQC